MGPTALLPLRRKACWGFFRPKNPTFSTSCEPAKLGTKGQHATSRPLKPLIDGFTRRWAYVSKQSFMSAELFPEWTISTYGCISLYLLATENMFSRSYSAFLVPALQQIFSNCGPHHVHYLLVAVIRRKTSTNSAIHFTNIFSASKAAKLNPEM